MSTHNPERRRDVSWVLWAGLPVLSLGIKFLFPLLGERRWEMLMTSELGFIENATVVFLIPAAVVGILIFLRRRELPRWVGWFVLLLAIAALYFAGEEISWGQHYFGWKSPEFFEQVNRQKETNIHNTLGEFGGNLLNNLPRQILNAAMMVAILLPLTILLLKRRFDRRGDEQGGKLPGSARRFVNLCTDRGSLWYWLIPNYRLVLIAAMAISLRLPHKIAKAFHAPPHDGYLSLSLLRASGEFKEYCFALAIMLFILSVYARMGPKKAPDRPSGRD